MANYNGRQPNNTSYIKTFVSDKRMNLWKTASYLKTDGSTESVITPSSTKFDNLYIPGDIIYDGSLISASDINLKKDVNLIKVDTTEKLMNLKANSFIFKDDSSNHIHYGFIAQDLENEFPELVQNKPNKMYNNNLKSVNYLEIIPLLVHKIQLMQKEIDELKGKINKPI
jgi:hypothetical protein